jgi:hypothetical protein
LRDATTDPSIIERAFRRYPTANLAIVPPENLLVLDVDGSVGEKSYRSLKLPATAFVETARGQHHYFWLKEGKPRKFEALKGVDIRTAENGYVIVPPSVHKAGHQYVWSSEEANLVEFRASLMRSTPSKVRIDFSGQGILAEQGNRNTTLTRFAGYLRYRGLNTGSIRAVLATLNDEVCVPPLPRPELEKIATSIGNYKTDFESAFGTLADVEAEDVQWLARPYFPLGATTVIDGNPGQGKSTFVMALIAAITTGRKPPFLSDLKSGNVVILSAEDDPARVLKPRLAANGANDKKIRFQKEPFTLDKHGLEILRAEIEHWKPVLVVIDPLIAYMEAGTDLNKANETMRFMVDLDLLAREFDTAILVVRHLRKSDAEDPLYRGLGSIAIAARVRSLLILGRHPEAPAVRAIVHQKCNYAPEGDTIMFEMVSKSGSEVPTVRWCGVDKELTADKLLSRPRLEPGRPNVERENAKEFLLEILKGGPKSKVAIERAAEARSISAMTLRRAAEELNIVKQRERKGAIWRLRFKDGGTRS